MLAATGAPFQPWMAYRNFSADTRHSDYYAETVLHAAMMGSDNLLFFNPYCPACGGSGALTPSADNALFSSILLELTDIVGCRDRYWLVAPPARAVPISEQAIENTTFGGDWDDEYFLTGIHLPTAAVTVYRFTPNVTAVHPNPQSYITQTKPWLALTIPMPNGTARLLNFSGGSVFTPTKTTSSAGLWIIIPTTQPYIPTAVTVAAQRVASLTLLPMPVVSCPTLMAAYGGHVHTETKAGETTSNLWRDGRGLDILTTYGTYSGILKGKSARYPLNTTTTGIPCCHIMSR